MFEHATQELNGNTKDKGY